MPHPTTDRAVGALLLLLLSPAAEAGPVLTLEEAYARALDRSPEIALLSTRIAEAEANVDRAWAILKPQWTANYTFTHIAPAPPEISFPDLQNENVVNNCQQGGDAVACIEALQESLANPVTLDLSQGDTHIVGSRITWSPLNGRAIPTIKNAYEAVELEKDRTTNQKRQIVLAVARAFYATSATKGAIAAAQRSLARTQEQLALIEARADVGEGSDAMLKAAQSAARQSQLDLSRAQNAHRQALLGLWLLTYSEDEPDVADPPTPELPVGDRDALRKEAMTRRKDLAAADKALSIAERAKTEVWWRFAPVVGLFGGYRYSNVRGLGGQNNQWTVGVNATMQLYDGGLRYGEMRAADARIQAALLSRRSLEHRLAGEIDRALLRLEGADLGVDRAKEAIEIAKQSLSVSTARFEVGAIRPIELKEANDRVLDADVALIRAQVERAIAILELRHAVGLE